MFIFLYINYALRIRYINTVGIEGILYLGHSVVIDGVIIFLGDLGKSGDAHGAFGKFADADFHRVGIEDPPVFPEYLLQQGNGLVMVVLVTDVEEKSNVPFLLVRAVGHLGRGDTGIRDENRLVVFRRNSRIHHLNPFDAAFYAADGDPISGFERLEDQDQKAGSEIRQIALQGQADSQAKGAERGQVLAKPGTIHPHTKFKAQVYVLTKDEGGRHTPFFNGYRPQFYFRTTDVTGVITLPEGTEMCMPGDNVKMEVELITPIAIEAGLRFAIREGGRTVGAGVVSEIEG